MKEEERKKTINDSCLSIKGKIFSVGLMFLLAVFFTTASYCAEETTLSDKEEIARIFSEREFVPLRSSHNVPECARLVDALHANQDYEIIDPILQTDDYKDKKLQSYIGKCSNLELDRWVEFEERTCANRHKLLSCQLKINTLRIS